MRSCTYLLVVAMSNAVAATAITAGGVTRMELFGGRRNMSYVLMDLIPDSKVDGANMGPIWGRQDPGGPLVGPMNFATMYLGYYHQNCCISYLRLQCHVSISFLSWRLRRFWESFILSTISHWFVFKILLVPPFVLLYITPNTRMRGFRCKYVWL